MRGVGRLRRVVDGGRGMKGCRIVYDLGGDGLAMYEDHMA
jgi:hypothetical protein